MVPAGLILFLLGPNVVLPYRPSFPLVCQTDRRLLGLGTGRCMWRGFFILSRSLQLAPAFTAAYSRFFSGPRISIQYHTCGVDDLYHHIPALDMYIFGCLPISMD